ARLLQHHSLRCCKYPDHRLEHSWRRIFITISTPAGFLRWTGRTVMIASAALSRLSWKHTMSRILAVLFCGLCWAGAATAAAPAPDRITMSIDAGKPGAKINRHIFGQFAEHLGFGIYDGIWVGRD